VTETSGADQEAKWQAAFAMFEKGEHPGFEESN
jgi:hypothetical protein